MHEVVCSPITHENLWDEKIMPGEIFIFMHENIKFPCMKMRFSCHNFFMRDTFCTGSHTYTS